MKSAWLCHDCCKMAGEIVGRDEELGSIYAVLDQTADGPAALVLEGEAGIGKSTLWLAGVEAARERGLRVLSSRPAEAERGLAHAGLGDLFENVLESVLPALPAPRRRALEVALLVEEAADGSDPRTLGVAVRSALEALVAEAPIVLAVDDVQWLDPSSASALAFALRRLREQPILLLLARRLGEEAEPRSSSGRSRPTASSGCPSARSVSAPHTASCRHGSDGRYHGRRSCACTRSRAETRSTRSSSPGL